MGCNLLLQNDKHIEFSARQLQIIIDNASKTLEDNGILGDF